MCVNDWKDIPGYEGLYQVNHHGEIWSLISNRKLKPSISHGGYKQFNLHKNKKSFIMMAHMGRGRPVNRKLLMQAASRIAKAIQDEQQRAPAAAICGPSRLLGFFLMARRRGVRKIGFTIRSADRTHQLAGETC